MLTANFPCLEVLVLHLLTPFNMSADAAKALPREVLAPLPALAPFCQPLREVRVKQSIYSFSPAGDITEAAWLRPRT